MKAKALLVVLFVMGFAVSVAVAGPGRGNRHHPSSTSTAATTTVATTTRSEAACRPVVGFVLRGEVVSVGTSSLTFNVKKANDHGRAYVGTQLSVLVDDRTKIRRHGPAKLAEIKPADWVKVQLRRCKTAEASAAFLARVILAREPSEQRQTTTEAP